MRDFKHPNMDGFECPICHTNADFPVVLIPIPSTREDNIVEAKQVHTECYKLVCKMKGVDPDIEESMSN